MRLRGRCAQELRRRRGYVLQYVIFMRVTYLLPHTAVNILAPIVNVPLRHFALGTFIGCLPQQFVAVRARRDATSPYRPLSGDATRRLHGLMLRKVPTIKPILERGWFLEQLAASEAKLAAMRSAEVDGGDRDGGLLAEVRAMLPCA